MNKTNLLIISFLFISVLQTSCISSAKFYTPNRNPLPLYKNKGDIYIDLSTNLYSTIDITAGYALIDGIALYAGYGGAKLNQTTDGQIGYMPTYTNYVYRGNMSNFGAGYFLSEKKSEKLRFEIFGDFATGRYNNEIDFRLYTPSNLDSTRYFNGNYSRIGILTNIGYSSFNGLLSYGYSLRLSNISFSNAYISDSVYMKKDIEKLNNKPYYQLLEHALFCKVGGRNVKGQIQLALYHGLNANPNIDAVPKQTLAINIGIVITPNIFNNKNDSKSQK